MPRARSPRPFLPTVLLPALLLAAPAAAQDRPRAPSDPREWVDRCRENDWGDRERFCEVRDSELPGSTRRLTIDGRRNGSVAVRGWDRGTILVRAKIQTQADRMDDARQLASSLRIRTDGGSIAADAPSAGRGDWTVSYEIWVPRASDYDLQIDGQNGGIAVADVGGRMRLETHNGGLSLDNVVGDVRARTQNGGVRVSLSGRQWNGSGLDVVTRNGGVRLDIPEGYNAELEAGTTNGSMRVDFPITVQGRVGRTLSTRLGSGGPVVRVMTTNGGVTIRRS